MQIFPFVVGMVAHACRACRLQKIETLYTLCEKVRHGWKRLEEILNWKGNGEDSANESFDRERKENNVKESITAVSQCNLNNRRGF